MEGAGTLRSTYNYDAYLTTGSRTSDFKFIRSYNDGTLTADLTLKNTQSAVDDLEGLDAEVNESFQVGLTKYLFTNLFLYFGFANDFYWQHTF